MTWSHAAFVTVVAEYLDKLSELHLYEACGSHLYMRKRRSKMHPILSDSDATKTVN